MHALLGGNNYYKAWQRKFGRQVKRVNDLMEKERRRWAIVQKDTNGLYVLDAELKHEMRRENVVPDVWVWPDKMGIYAHMVGPHNMDYDKRGPLANENREKGDKHTTFRGLPVFEAQSFDVDFTGEPIDLLIREQQCGEWFYMHNKHWQKNPDPNDARAYVPKRIGPPGNDRQATPSDSDIIIYSADSDKFERIKWVNALAAAELAEPGEQNTMGDSNDMESSKWDEKLGVWALRVATAPGQPQQYEAASRRMIELRRQANAGEEINEDDRRRLGQLERVLPKGEYDDQTNKYGNGLALEEDHDIILFRPSQTYRMASAILAKGGSETGATYHGHHDFQLSDDIIRKIHVGHYTFYSKAVVKKPKNYVIVENIFSQGYVDGEGTDFPRSANDRDNRSRRLGEFFTSVQEGTDRCDLIAFKVPRGTDEHLNKCIDITGRFDSGIYDQLKTHKDRSQEHFPRSNILYNAMRAKEIDMYRETLQDEYLQRIKRVNTVCWRGMQLDARNKITHLNTGHWGVDIYPGCRSVRDGHNTHLQSMEWAKAMSFIPMTNVAQENLVQNAEVRG